MASATLSDPLLYAVFVSTLAVVTLSVLMLAAIVLLRLRLIWKERRTGAILRRWRPLLSMAAAGDLTEGPPVGRALGTLLLPHWLQLREAVRGESEKTLDAFARSIGLDRTARALLGSRRAHARLLGINALGRLGTRESAAELERHSAVEDPIVSFAAARALLRLDFAAALPRLLPLMLARTDWSVARLLPTLRMADMARLELVLAGALPRVQDGELERLLSLATALPPERSAQWARAALARAGSPGQIAAALRLVGDPRDAPQVRRLLQHPAWQVRVRAIATLERIAGAEDLPRLVAALADPEWWVRMRAARAIARLPFLGDADFNRLRASVSDRYARDALAQAMAEERGA